MIVLRSLKKIDKFIEILNKSGIGKIIEHEQKNIKNQMQVILDIIRSI